MAAVQLIKSMGIAKVTGRCLTNINENNLRRGWMMENLTVALILSFVGGMLTVVSALIGIFVTEWLFKRKASYNDYIDRKGMI